MFKLGLLVFLCVCLNDPKGFVDAGSREMACYALIILLAAVFDDLVRKT